MSDVIKDFFVGLGFKGDEGSAKKAVDLANKTEAAVTKAATEGSGKRVEAETQASDKRATLAQQLGKILASLEQDRADKATKIRKDEAGKDERLQAEREKKAKERRTAALKELQVNATRMASFALAAVGAIEATALGIVVATDRAARSMERLNYASQRAGTTPGRLTAYEYASRQLGGEEGAGSRFVSTVGERLKTPGYDRMLKSQLGVDTRNRDGSQRDREQIALDIGEALSKRAKSGGAYGYATAKVLGQQFGLDDAEFQTAIDPRMRGMAAERQAIDARTGANQGDAAAGGTAFEQSMRRLEAMADSIRTKVSTSIFSTLTPELDKLAKWVDEHGEQIANVIDRIAKSLIAFAEDGLKRLAGADWDAVLKDVGVLADKFIAVANAVEVATGKFVAIGAAIEDKVIGPVKALLGFLGKIDQATSGNIGDVTENIKAALGFAKKVDTATATDPAAAAKILGDVDQGTSAKSGVWSWLKNKMGLGDDPDARRVKDAIIATAEGVKKLADNGGVGGGSGSPGGTGGGGGIMGSAGRALRNAAAAAGAGFSGSHSRPAKGALAANQKEAYAAALKEGLSPVAARALVANMSGEGLAVPHDYHWDGTHMAQGIVQWDPTRSSRIAAQFGKQPKDMTVAEQTKAAIWEMQSRPEYGATARALKGDNGPAMIDALVDNYERPGNRGKAKAERYGFYRGFNPTDNAPTAMAPASEGTSAKAIGDAEVFAARQRLAAGGNSAADRALVAGYLAQQNAGDHLIKASKSKTLEEHNAKIALLDEQARSARQHLRNMQTVLRAHQGNVVPFLHPHAHLSSSARNSIDNSQKHVAMTHSPTFNIHGGDPHSMLADAHRLAGRGQADMVRNLSVAEA